ncbi:MAG: DUF6510 family protein, partial [Rhodoglobus sp.]
GNVLAGVLSGSFDVDPTIELGRCLGCGDVSPLAMAMVWVKKNHSFIVRCHVCDEVLMIAIEKPSGATVTTPGVELLGALGG